MELQRHSMAFIFVMYFYIATILGDAFFVLKQVLDFAVQFKLSGVRC